MWLCGSVDLRICRYDSRVYGLGDMTVIVHTVLWLLEARHLAVGCCFHTPCRWAYHCLFVSWFFSSIFNFVTNTVCVDRRAFKNIKQGV